MESIETVILLDSIVTHGEDKYRYYAGKAHCGGQEVLWQAHGRLSNLSIWWSSDPPKDPKIKSELSASIRTACLKYAEEQFQKERGP